MAGPKAGYRNIQERQAKQAGSPTNLLFGNWKKKLRRTKSWQLPNVSLPGLQSIKRNNKRIDNERIADLARRIDHKEKLADEHYLAGRPGKAIKMMKRRRANLRELARLDAGRAAAIQNRKAV